MLVSGDGALPWSGSLVAGALLGSYNRGKSFSESVGSQWPSPRTSPHAKVADFGEAHSEPLPNEVG